MEKRNYYKYEKVYKKEISCFMYLSYFKYSIY